MMTYPSRDSHQFADINIDKAFREAGITASYATDASEHLSTIIVECGDEEIETIHVTSHYSRVTNPGTYWCMSVTSNMPLSDRLHAMRFVGDSVVDVLMPIVNMYLVYRDAKLDDDKSVTIPLSITEFILQQYADSRTNYANLCRQRAICYDAIRMIEDLAQQHDISYIVDNKLPDSDDVVKSIKSIEVGSGELLFDHLEKVLNESVYNRFIHKLNSLIEDSDEKFDYA